MSSNISFTMTSSFVTEISLNPFSVPSTVGLPIEGDIRLNDGTEPYNGRVEIFHMGRWGSLCDDDLGYKGNNAVAHVICRQLNLPYRGAHHVKGGHFGKASGTIWLDNVKCEGSEPALAKCEHNGWERHNCNHGEDAGVNCTDAGSHVMPTPNSGAIIGGSVVAGFVILIFILFLAKKFKLGRKIRKLIFYSPPTPSSKRPSIVVVSNKDLYNNDMPDEAWASTITMVHPLFQAFSVSCNLSGIPEDTSEENPRGNPNTATGGADWSFSAQTTTGTGAKHLKDLFKECSSNDHQDLSNKFTPDSEKNVAMTNLESSHNRQESIISSEEGYYCLEETTEAGEPEDRLDCIRKDSSDSSDLDISEPVVVSVSRFHYLN